MARATPAKRNATVTNPAWTYQLDSGPGALSTAGGQAEDEDDDGCPAGAVTDERDAPTGGGRDEDGHDQTCEPEHVAVVPIELHDISFAELHRWVEHRGLSERRHRRGR